MITNRKLKLYILWPLAVLAALLLIARVCLSPLVSYGASRWLEQQGMESEIRELSFDLGEGWLLLEGLDASADGSTVLSLQRLELAWSWSALFDKQVVLNSIGVEGISFDVERGPGPRLVIAGLDLAKPATADEADAVDSAPPDWSIEVRRIDIDNFKNCYRALPQYDYCNSFASLDWEGRIFLDLAQIAATPLPLQADGKFTLTGLKLHNNLLQRDLLTLDSFELAQVRIFSLDSIAIDKVELQTLAMLERSDKTDSPQIKRLDSLTVSQLELARLAHLDIAEISVRGHAVTLVKDKNAEFEITQWFPPADGNAETVEETTEADPQTAFSYAIGKFIYKTDHSIQFHDLSLERPFIVKLNNIELVVENIDSRNPEQASRIEYSATVADHGTVRLSGNAQPLAVKPSFDIKGKIEGLDLRDLSAFTADAIGHTIKSGQLDADLKLVARQGVLYSEVDLTLNQFKLSALSAKDKQKIDASFGFPLNTSLSLLKDRDSRIQLKIPITGDLQNPDFDPSDAITRATSSAITSAVLNYYTPFGLVTLVDGLFSLATALKFEPVVFANGMADVGQVDPAGLDKIADLMRDRPGVDVTLCASTNTADRIGLLPDTAEVDPQALELDSEQLTRLVQLGEARAAGIKNYLVSKQIDPARLVLCAPEHREGEGLAGVEISI